LSIGETIGTLAGIIALIVSLITIAGFIRKAGKVEQGFQDGLKRLDEWRLEDQKRLTGIGDELKGHIDRPGIHVNPVVEQRDYDARIRFQEEVKSKLQKLLEK
jgi:hypothetical protein